MNKRTEQVVGELRMIDDDMFRIVASDPLVCQEILQVLLNDSKLSVSEVIMQDRQINIGREVVLDAKCVLGDGTLCNVEVQKERVHDDIRRIRFHAAAMTVSHTPKNTPFSNIPNVKVVYITEYDVFGNGQVLTKVNRCVHKNGEYVPVDDGEECLFANATVRDGSLESELLKLFLERNEIRDERFPKLRDGFNYFKTTEGGRAKMSNVVEEYAKEYAEEESAKAIIEVYLEFNLPKEAILERVKKKLNIAAEKAEEYWNEYSSETE